MERMEVGRLGDHDDVSYEYELDEAATIERFVCNDCGKTAPTEDKLLDEGCG